MNERKLYGYVWNQIIDPGRIPQNKYYKIYACFKIDGNDTYANTKYAQGKI